MIKILDAALTATVIWSLVIWDMMGVVLATEGWMKVGAILCPPYSMYLVVQHVMQLTHFM